MTLKCFTKTCHQVSYESRKYSRRRFIFCNLYHLILSLYCSPPPPVSSDKHTQAALPKSIDSCQHERTAEADIGQDSSLSVDFFFPQVKGKMYIMSHSVASVNVNK